MSKGFKSYLVNLVEKAAFSVLGMVLILFFYEFGIRYPDILVYMGLSIIGVIVGLSIKEYVDKNKNIE